MRARVLQKTTYAKDTSGAPLVVGEVAEVDPALAGAWATAGIIKVVEHDRPTGPTCDAPRDYLAERMKRKRAERDAAIRPKKKRKPLKQEQADDGTKQSGTDGVGGVTGGVAG